MWFFYCWYTYWYTIVTFLLGEGRAQGIHSYRMILWYFTHTHTIKLQYRLTTNLNNNHYCTIAYILLCILLRRPPPSQPIICICRPKVFNCALNLYKRRWRNSPISIHIYNFSLSLSRSRCRWLYGFAIVIKFQQCFHRGKQTLMLAVISINCLKIPFRQIQW